MSNLIEMSHLATTIGPMWKRDRDMQCLSHIWAIEICFSSITLGTKRYIGGSPAAGEERLDPSVVVENAFDEAVLVGGARVVVTRTER